MMQLPPEQSPLLQSRLEPHFLLFAQFAQLPPQSTSVSLPFSTWSLQLAAAQWPALQTPLTQSPAAPHATPSEHAGHVPPQSTALSEPFFV
jgi:hypothetical protein